MKTMIALLTVSAAGACSQPGDFCVVYTDPIGPFAPETAAQIVKTDRLAGEDIAVRDEYWMEYCR